MKTRSLQRITDSYLNRGYKFPELRKILAKDKEYQEILKQRKQKLGKKSGVTQKEKKKYVLSTDKDFEILAKCKQLERLSLEKEDKLLVKFLKTQLENDWRSPLLTKLNQLLKKYQKTFK